MWFSIPEEIRGFIFLVCFMATVCILTAVSDAVSDWFKNMRQNAKKQNTAKRRATHENKYL